MSNEKKLTIRIDADDRATARLRAIQQNINQANRSLNEVASAVTGGLIGGGIMASMMAAIGIARELIDKAGKLVIDSRQLGVTPSGLQRARDLAAAAGSPELANQSIQNARQARAEALAGEPNAAKAFRDLGLSVESLAKANPLALRDAILEAFRTSSQGREQREALRGLLGNEAGTALESLAAGGFFSREGMLKDAAKRFASTWISNPTLVGLSEKGGGMPLGQLAFPWINDVLSGIVQIRSRRMDPLAQFGQGDEERVGMMREINTQRAAELSRSQLTTEQRLNAALQERARLLNLIENTVNPIARERLVARALGVEAEIVDLQNKGTLDKQAALLGQAGSAAALTRSTDPLRSLGFDLGRLTGSGPNYPQQMVKQGQQHQRTLEEIRGELRKFNE
jgi:hypothetical protein